MTTPPIIRLFNKVKFTDNCWEWTGCKDSGGYGQVGIKGKMKPAHVISYNYFKGSIPKGLELDHLCRNKACVNPDHLEPVTHQENVKRGNAGKHLKNRKIRKYNEAWCSNCKKFLPKENFHKNKNRWNGVNNRCKKCYSIEGKIYRKKEDK